MKQFLAGSIIDNLFEVFDKNTSKKSSAKKLSKWLSHFQLNSKSNFEYNKVEYSSNIAVIINILQRGLPTKLNHYALEQLIAQSGVFKFNPKDESSYSLIFEENQNELADLIFKSLHIIDSRISLSEFNKSYQQSWEKLGSEFEENFLLNKLPNALGENGAFIIQLIASQRSVGSIIAENINTNNLQNNIRQNFEEQRTDFSIEFPYNEPNKVKGIVIEIDGSQHQNSEQQFLDTERDRAVATSGWNNTLRIKTSEFKSDQISDSEI